MNHIHQNDNPKGKLGKVQIDLDLIFISKKNRLIWKIAGSRSPGSMQVLKFAGATILLSHYVNYFLGEVILGIAFTFGTLRYVND